MSSTYVPSLCGAAAFGSVRVSIYCLTPSPSHSEPNGGKISIAIQSDSTTNEREGREDNNEQEMTTKTPSYCILYDIQKVVDSYLLCE